MASVTLNFTDPVTHAAVDVTSKNFSPGDMLTFRQASGMKLTGLLTPYFPTLAHNALSTLVPGQNVVVGGITARLFEPAAVNPNRAKIVTAIRSALQIISGDGVLAFPNNQLNIYLIEGADVSLGYYYHAAGADTAAIVVGKTAVQRTASAMNRTVAEAVYDYYYPTWSVNGLEKRILTTIIHEMGHVFPQMNALEQYMTMARCSELGGQGILGTVQQGFSSYPAKLLDFHPAPTPQEMVDFIVATRNVGGDVSNYAYSNGLNEFVAETFAALVMGAPVGSDQNAPTHFSGKATHAEIMAAYNALGGPTPNVAIRHARTGQSAKKQFFYAFNAAKG